jgi:hypothetical protein
MDTVEQTGREIERGYGKSNRVCLGNSPKKSKVVSKKFLILLYDFILF